MITHSSLCSQLYQKFNTNKDLLVKIRVLLLYDNESAFSVSEGVFALLP